MDKAAYAQTASPIILPIASFASLSLAFSNSAAVVTVAVDILKTGDFANTVTLEGTGKYRWPAQDQMHKIYCASYIKITWDVGTMRAFMKG